MKNLKNPLFLSLGILAGLIILPFENGHAKGFKFYGQSPYAFGAPVDECSRDIGAIDRLAVSMLKSCRAQAAERSNDTDSVALLRQMERHAELTGLLIRAYQSRNNEAFRSSLEEVRRSFGQVERLAPRAKTGAEIMEMIRESSPLLAKVERHLSHFQSAE